MNDKQNGDGRIRTADKWRADEFLTEETLTMLIKAVEMKLEFYNECLEGAKPTHGGWAKADALYNVFLGLHERLSVFKPEPGADEAIQNYSGGAW